MTSVFKTIPLGDLQESPFNPRRHFDAAALAELAESLKASGQLEPLLVRPVNGKHEILAGHRRFRAATIAGLTELAAVVQDLDDQAALEVLTISNLQRDDLHPLEEAQGFADLIKRARYDVAKIAARIGLSERYVYDRLKLLQLIPAAKKLFLAGAMEVGHAIILARLPNEHQQRAVGDVEELADGGLRSDRESLLFRDATVGDGDENESLPLNDRIRPVTVRQFQAAVDRHLRATPEVIDPVLFPETAQALEAAQEHALKVISITREYRVHDDARDEKTRTYGAQSWQRADGKPDDDGKPSKTCDWSRYGFVAAGPGRGDCFLVCVNRDKCQVHWKKEAQAKARRAKQTKAGGEKESFAERERRRQEEWKRQQEERKAAQARLEKALPSILEALAEKVKAAPTTTPGPLGKLLLRSMRSARSSLIPPGKTADDLVRHLAFSQLANINTGWPDNDLRAVKAFGVDWPKIVDQVAPQPAEPPKPRRPTKAKKGKKAVRP